MKTIRLIAAASAAFFIVGTAVAQNAGTVNNHAFPIGKGAGVTGYSSLLLANGAIPIGQTGADPLGIVPTGDVTISAAGVTAIGTAKVVTAMMALNSVTNARLSQMANGTFKCRNTAGTGDPEDCTAAQVRTILALTIGTNVQAWDTDLDCLAALSGTGIIRRTGTGTCSNGTVVANSELATMAAYTFKGNATGSTAAPTDVDIGALTAKASPAGTDEVMIRDNAASGAWKRSPVSALAGGGGAVTSLNGQTGALASYFPPQGRLTLISGSSVMQSSQAGATTVYYTPHVGDLIPLYDGTNLVPTLFTEVSQATTDTTKSPAAVAASSCYDDFAWTDAGTFRVTRGPAWTNTSTRSAGTALVKVKGLWLNSVSITNGPAASRGTYVGTICSNASSTIDYVFGAISSGSTPGNFNVWNAYNRVLVASLSGDNSGATEVRTAPTAVWQTAFTGGAVLRTTFVIGLVAEQVKGRYDGFVGVNTNNVAGGNVGLNNTTTPMGNGTAVTTAGFQIGPIFGGGPAYPVIGVNYLQALHYILLANSVTFSSNGGAGSIQAGLTTEVWM